MTDQFFSDIPHPLTGLRGHASRALKLSTRHDRLYFVSGYYLSSFSLTESTFSVHVRGRPIGHVDVDDDHVYFGDIDVPMSLRRMPLDHEPIYTLPR